MTHIPDAHGRADFGAGQDAITIGAGWAVAEILAHLAVADARAHKGDAFPYYGPDPTPAATGHRIIGRLLDAGWRPPDDSHVLDPCDAMHAGTDTANAPTRGSRWRRTLSRTWGARDRSRGPARPTLKITLEGERTLMTPDLDDAACPHCGERDLRIEFRLTARLDAALAGTQPKLAAAPWPWLVCGNCRAESRGKPA
ncbi:hypothetical protein [Streptomyces fractus]|uniref:hypothetical protein n=1 Tax=Streptomyces fractus TaxID=641806 RepID=UPI003CEBEE67